MHVMIRVRGRVQMIPGADCGSGRAGCHHSSVGEDQPFVQGLSCHH